MQTNHEQHLVCHNTSKILWSTVGVVGDKKKLEAWGLSKQQLNGKFGFGTVNARFFPILEKNLFN